MVTIGRTKHISPLPGRAMHFYPPMFHQIEYNHGNKPEKKQIAIRHDKCLTQPAPMGLSSIKTSANDKSPAQTAPTKESATKTQGVIFDTKNTVQARDIIRSASD